MVLLFFLAWILCGFVSWCGILGTLYSIGKKYPRLGTADEQWKEEAWEDRGFAGVVFILGPIGLIASFFATGMFYNGFRIW